MSLINNMLNGLEKDSVRHIPIEDEESHFSWQKIKTQLSQQSGFGVIGLGAILVLFIGFVKYGFVTNNEHEFAIGYKKSIHHQDLATALPAQAAIQQQPQIQAEVAAQAQQPVQQSQILQQPQALQQQIQSQPLSDAKPLGMSMPVANVDVTQATQAPAVIDNSPLGLSLKALEVSNQDESQTDMSRLLAISYVHMNRIEDAINILSGSNPDMKSDPEHYALLAALYQRDAQHQKAIEIYWKLVETFPQGGKWWAGLAISLEAIGEKKDALEGYKHARLYKDLSQPLAQYVEQRIKTLKRYS